MRILGKLAAAALLLIAAFAAHAAPQVGWWWNPNESGRGFFIESQNGIFYLAGYFYDPSGRATWAVAGSPNADPYRFDGRLLAYANGQSLFGDYRAPSAPADVGAISVRFSDDTHGTLTWPGGTVAIERQVFGAGTPPFQPSNGWWWNETESGRGYTIELQGDKLFVAGFMYDDAGNPVWYYSAGSMSSPTKYSAPWLQFANGQTMTGPYRPPSAPATAGQLEIEFVAKDQATMKFSDSASPAGAPVRVAADGTGEEPARAQPLASRGKIITIKRQFPDAPSGGGGGGGGGGAPGAGGSFDPPPTFKGRVTQKNKSIVDVDGLTTAEIMLTGNDLVWRRNELANLNPLYSDSYDLMSGTLTVRYDFVQIVKGGSCQDATVTFDLPLGKSDGTLEVGSSGKYRIRVHRYPITFESTRTCNTPSGSATFTIPHDEWSLDVRAEGAIVQDQIYAEYLDVPYGSPPVDLRQSVTVYLQAVR